MSKDDDDSLSNDEKLFNARPPSSSDLKGGIKRVFQKWMNYLRQTPTPFDLDEKIMGFFSDFNLYHGVPGLQSEAIELAETAFTSIQRAGRGYDFTKQLMSLYSQVADKAEPEQIASTLEMLLHQYVSDGNLTQANIARNQLLYAVRRHKDISILETLVAFIAVIVVRGVDPDDRVNHMRVALLNYGELTKNKTLKMRLFSLLAQRACGFQNADEISRYAELLYESATQLGDKIGIANAFHYRAFGYIYQEEWELAEANLKMAYDKNAEVSDKHRMRLVMATWGMCLFKQGQFAAAAAKLTECLSELKGRGYYEAQTLNTLALAQMELHNFEDSLRTFKQAMAIYDRQRMPFEVLCTRHGISYVYFLQGIYHEAIHIAEWTLAKARRLKHYRRDWLVNELTNDLAMYRKAAQESQNRNRPQVVL